MGAQVHALLEGGSMEALPTVFATNETNAGVAALMAPLQDAWKVLYTLQYTLQYTSQNTSQLLSLPLMHAAATRSRC